MILALEQLLDLTMTGTVVLSSASSFADPDNDPLSDSHPKPSGTDVQISPVAILKPLISVCLDLIEEERSRAAQLRSRKLLQREGSESRMEDDNPPQPSPSDDTSTRDEEVFF